MITTEYRPKRLADIIGQSLPKKVLKAIVKSPEDAPRSLIFSGAYGTGKTSAARAFARALMCPSSREGGDSCGKSSCVCSGGLEGFPVYEFDSSVIGLKDEIKGMRDLFFYDTGDRWRVFILDEAHLMTSQAQSAMLKILEEAPRKAFFIFPTTNVEKFLTTLVSRSLELRFDLLSEKDIEKSLSVIAEAVGMTIDPEVLKLIVFRSGGHMRDAQMLLDSYRLLGEDSFVESMRSAVPLYEKFIYHALNKSKDGFLLVLEELERIPLAYLKVDFYRMLSLLMRGFSRGSVEKEGERLLLGILGGKVVTLFKYAMQDWVSGGFGSELAFPSMMLALADLLGGVDKW